MEYLELYNHAKQALSEAYSVDELSAIIDQADIIKYAAKVANDNEMVIMATEIKLRAERRFGEVSRELPTMPNDGSRNRHVKAVDMTPKQRVLESVGVSRQMANQFEKLADIPEEKFEKAISEFHKEGELSRAKLLNTVKKVESVKQDLIINITPKKHPNQILLEQVLSDIINMDKNQIIEYIKNRIKTYENENIN